MQGRKPAGEHAQCAEAPPVVIVIRRPETVKRAGVRSTVRQGAAGSSRCLALQHGALDVHDLVAEAGEEADLVAREGVTPFSRFLISLPR